MDRQFRGIWIPKEIWLEENLSILEKIILVEIDSLEDEKQGCFASNKHFADFFKLSNGRISQIINNLKEKGYISISYEYNGKEIAKRILKINRPPYPEVFNKLNRYLENDNRGIKFSKGGYLENAKDNNTNINNKNNNIIIVEQAINYMNELASTSFKSKTSKTISLITARLKEGFNIEDLKDVIYYKYKEWYEKPFKFKNGVMSDTYYRPNTLFGTKFEEYLQNYRREYK